MVKKLIIAGIGIYVAIQLSSFVADITTGIMQSFYHDKSVMANGQIYPVKGNISGWRSNTMEFTTADGRHMLIHGDWAVTMGK